MALFFDRYTELVPIAQMRVVALRRLQNPSLLLGLGGGAQTCPCLPLRGALLVMRGRLGPCGHLEGRGPYCNPRCRRGDCTKSACFSSWGKHVRDALVCHTRS